MLIIILICVNCNFYNCNFCYLDFVNKKKMSKVRNLWSCVADKLENFFLKIK